MHNGPVDINILPLNGHSKPDGCFLTEKYTSTKQTESESDWNFFDTELMIQGILDFVHQSHPIMGYVFDLIV